MRRAADLLWRGSQILADRIPAGIATWAEEGKERNDRVLRWLVAVLLVVVPLLIAIRPKTLAAWLAVAGLTGTILVAARLAPILAVILVVSLLATTAPALMWLFVIAWITGAVLAAWPKKKAKTKKPKKGKGKKARKGKGKRPADAPHEAVAEPEPMDPRAELVETLLDVIGDANGIHLRDLYPRLRQCPGWGHLDDPAMRGVLDDYGIPTVRAMSVGGVDGRTGIRREALQALAWEISQGVPYSASSGPSRIPESGPDLRKSGAPLGSESAILGPSRPSESDLNAHIDDALGLVSPRRSGAA